MKNIPKSDFISSRVRYIPLERIVPNPHQPRRDFDPEGLSELADSIRQYGVLQPATAVSYTHLDVYKRQGCKCGILSLWLKIMRAADCNPLGRKNEVFSPVFLRRV